MSKSAICGYVNKDRIVSDFLELVQIDSLSLNERVMADTLKKRLENFGLSVYEDDAGVKTGGNTGNLITTLKGDPEKPALLLMAHMDTVAPGLGKKPVIKDGMIYSDGTTILGGDDAGGLCVILEILRIIKEKELPHGDIQIVFSIAEEIGLQGSGNMDYSKIHAKYGLVLDSDGEIGEVAVNAPSQNRMDVEIIGRAAHAGMEPEKGVSAVQIFARAVNNMKLGRIDFETTANVGTVNGGRAMNIVCDSVKLVAEARSRDKAKLEAQTEHMRSCFEEAASFYGGKVQFNCKLMYPSYRIGENDDIIKFLKTGSEKSGIELKLTATGGGSDTNILNGRGIQAVDVAINMQKVHTTNECIAIDDMVKCAELLLNTIIEVK